MKNRKRIISAVLGMTMALSLLAGCGQTADMKGSAKDVDRDARPSVSEDSGKFGDKLPETGKQAPSDKSDKADVTDKAVVDDELAADDGAGDIGDAVVPGDEDIEETEPPLAGSALPSGISPVASGTLVASGDNSSLDYSNSGKGYFMAKWTGGDVRIKVQSTGPSGVTYTYDLPAGSGWTAFPFSDGSGDYLLRVMRNTTGSKYAVALKTTVNVQLEDAFVPFLTSNQYVDFDSAPKAVELAGTLCSGKDGALDKVAAVYDWVVGNLVYDYDLANSVKSGYVPSLDAAVANKKGICFDYAALMAGMLRSQGVPCKLVFGYAGQAYHAWISVWVDGQGWVDGAIFFDGKDWQRMDPTFASTGNRDDSIMQYIGDGSHYTVKYLY